MSSPKFSFVVSPSQKAQDLYQKFKKDHRDFPCDEADHIIILGGDGTMLQTLHKQLGSTKKIYGINCGTVGFMMNPYTSHDLDQLLTQTQEVTLFPLKMTAIDKDGKIHHAHAINEVHLFRQTHQTARIEICIDGHTEMDDLAADGVLVSTPAGSTAYNYSAHGPILPLSSNLLALTPLNPFRPRRWRGALLMHDKTIQFNVHDYINRPVSAVADNQETRDIRQVEVIEDITKPVHILYNQDDHLEEKILNEQFQA